MDYNSWRPNIFCVVKFYHLLSLYDTILDKYSTYTQMQKYQTMKAENE